MHEPDILFLPGFINAHERGALMDALLAATSLKVEEVRVFGKRWPTPRRTAWHADDGCVYRYSGLTMTPAPWTPPLHALRDALERRLEAPFNCVLINHYRSGADRMGWHADDEACFGPLPTIASLSLGATRRFVMKHRQSGVRREWALADGDLLVMRGRCQLDWVHCIPATRKPIGERLNLTWRRFLDTHRVR